jgi:L,D-transpeptidase ErfK/SrfK
VVFVIAMSAGPAGRVSAIVGDARTYQVQRGESLVSIGARLGIDLRTLAEDNDLPVQAVLKPGMLLRVDNRHLVPAGNVEGIVINVPQRMLFLFERGALAAAYPVAAGRADWPTPLGSHTIGVKEVDPTWDVPVSIQREMAAHGRRVVKRVAPGHDNPLGDRWLGLSGIDVGIHGTNQPTSIFRLTTHGCIRLHPDDARDLFERVEVGTTVAIIYEPILVARTETGQVWVEIHTDAYRHLSDPAGRARQLLVDAGVDGASAARLVADMLPRLPGRAHEVGRAIAPSPPRTTLIEPTGDPICTSSGAYSAP